MKVLNVIKDYLVITFGIFIAAVAVYFFLVPSGVTVGSASGFGVVLSNFIPLPLSTITFIINVVLLVVGFILIGKDFGIKTVYSSLSLSVFLGIFEIIFPNQQAIMGDQFVDMVCYLFVIAIGQAILFKCNASSGGLDIVGKIINKFFRVELGKAISMAGICVALMSAFTSDAKSVVLSLLGTYLSGIVLDHFIFGLNIKRRVCIISKKENEIKEFILHQLHSGATIYEAIGAYDNKSRREIIAIVDKNEYSKLMNFIVKTDPDAFLTVYNVNEVIYKPKVY
ncbi:MAG: YitT family protein [Lachnospiraceae bacterium]|nr:YitT family protein [Lachnospiraceae bacterium]